ncbi:MAG: AAA family ATPase [Proteobacteria bacterium]|nr:AAA family ATPase [Pseudomonadota bacterium]MCP4921544.1 AAA family ATPase [Pseudomonadota bacterium]
MPARSVAGTRVECMGDVDLCPGLVDSLEAMVEAHPRLELDETGPLELVIRIEDHVFEPREALRVSVAAGERGTQLGEAQGIGADHVPWRQLDLVWVLGLILAALASAIGGQRVRGESRGFLPSTGRVGLGVALGAVFALWAMDWTPMAPALDHPALTPAGLPALAPLIWAVDLAGTLLVVPGVGCALGVLVLGRRLGLQALDRFDLGLLAPGAVAGALGVGLASIPVGMGPDGLFVCAAVGIPGVMLAAASGGVIEDTVHAGIGRGTPRRLFVPLGIATGAALALMPLALSGRLLPLVLLAGCAAAAGVAVLGRTERRLAETSADLSEGVAGSLRSPRYVAGAGRDPGPLVSELRTPGFHQLVIEGPDGVGKSRFAREVIRRLELPGLRVGVGEAEAPAGEGKTAPYAVLSVALGQVLGEHLELAAVQARESALSEAAGAASEAALEVLPGVGVLLSLGDGRDAESLTVERLRRDVTRAVRDALQTGPVAVLIDDLQWADPSSLGLLGHLHAMLTEPDEPPPHPFVLVLVQRPDDGPHQELSDPEHRLVLEPFSAGEVAELLLAAGMNAQDGFASTVADRVGGRPRHLRELEEMRIARIDDPRRRLLLQAAASCGRTFPTEALASGLGWTRIEVLSELAEIERTVGLIEDLDDDERFRFRTELTRQVLAASAQLEGGGPRKVIREFHRRVVDHLSGLESAPLGDLVMHALHGGDATRGAAARYAVLAAEQSARQGALPEAVDNIEIARRLGPHLDQASADRLDLVEARVLRRGETSDQRRAIALFRRLVESPHVDALEVVNSWFFTAFSLRGKSDLSALIEEIHGVRERLDDASQHSLVEAVCDFYNALARSEARGIRPGPDADLAEELQVQLDRLRPLEPSRDRDLLLARVLQAQASRLADHDTYLAVSRESLELKERHGDLAGQAITMGMLANYFLWWAAEPDPAEARRWLEKDLEQVDRMGDMGARSSILNRMALSYGMEGRPNQALDNAVMALRRARQAASAVDVLFAAFAVIRYASEVGALEQVDRVGNKLVQPPEHWPWSSAEELLDDVPKGILEARGEELSELGPALDEVGADTTWRTRLEALLR